MPASRMHSAIFSGAEVDLDAERRQRVGRAGFRRERAVAVLGDRHAGAGDDEGRAGRDVVGAGGVAAGADDVDRALRRLDRRHARRAWSRRRRRSRPTVSPRTRSAIRKPPICARRRLARHDDVEGASASSRVSCSPGGDLGEEALHVGHVRRARRPARALKARGDLEEILEDAVAVLGGDAFGMELHAVHRIGSRWRTPMITPSSVWAVASRSSGMLSGAIVSEW